MVCFFQAEDCIRYLVRSRGLGDVYKRQEQHHLASASQSFKNDENVEAADDGRADRSRVVPALSLIHI